MNRFRQDSAIYPIKRAGRKLLSLRSHLSGLHLVELRVFTRGDVKVNIEITRLRTDLASSPFQWTIHDVPIPQARVDDGFHLKSVPKQGNKAALLIFPFEPHSIVMAALSRKNLVGAGHKVELLCYPDTAGSPGWLWDNVLPEITPAAYRRLVVSGDRLDTATNPHFLETVRRWQEGWRIDQHPEPARGKRHSVSSLLQLGAEVVLGATGHTFGATLTASRTWHGDASLHCVPATRPNPQWG